MKFGTNVADRGALDGRAVRSLGDVYVYAMTRFKETHLWRRTK